MIKTRFLFSHWDRDACTRTKKQNGRLAFLLNANQSLFDVLLEKSGLKEPRQILNRFVTLTNVSSLTSIARCNQTRES